MKTQPLTLEGHIYRTQYEWQDTPSYFFAVSDACDSHTTCIQPHTISVEIPSDFDPRPQQIAYLRAQQQKLQETTFQELRNMDTEIQKLLALEAPTPTPSPSDAEVQMAASYFMKDSHDCS